MKFIISVSTAAMAAFLSAAPAAAQDPIVVDQERTISGRLENSDPALAAEMQIEGEAEAGPVHYDDYRMRLNGGQRMRLTVRTDEFDPIVSVYRPGATDEAIAENDDDGTSLNSRLTFTPPADGVYVVRVRSFAGGMTGAYALGAAPLPPLPQPVSLARGGTRERSVMRVFRGTLDSGDAEIGGQHVDDYVIRVRAGEPLLIRVDSSAFDPVVSVVSASDREGEALGFDDDTGPGTNALLAFDTEEGGDYIIRVAALGEDGHGAYTLRVGR
jgi:hypothetical protein